MSTHQVLFVFALATALAVPNASHAEPNAGRAQCFLDEGRILSVKPYYGKATLGRVVIRPLHGAEVQLVPAIGLSSERLQAHLQRLLHSPRREPLPACLADVGHVHIESDPLGSASSVQLIARHPNDAELVFRRAQRLVSE